MRQKSNALSLCRTHVLEMMKKYDKRSSEYQVLEEVLLFMNLHIGGQSLRGRKFEYGDTKELAREFVQKLTLMQS